jgi:2-keto-3-deoxy-galactonokinase
MGTHTIVIDLEAQTLVARLPGTYRRWVQVDGGALIATSEAVARLPL